MLSKIDSQKLCVDFKNAKEEMAANPNNDNCVEKKCSSARKMMPKKLDMEQSVLRVTNKKRKALSDCNHDHDSKQKNWSEDFQTSRMPKKRLLQTERGKVDIIRHEKHKTEAYRINDPEVVKESSDKFICKNKTENETQKSSVCIKDMRKKETKQGWNYAKHSAPESCCEYDTEVDSNESEYVPSSSCSSSHRHHQATQNM